MHKIVFGTLENIHYNTLITTEYNRFKNRHFLVFFSFGQTISHHCSENNVDQDINLIHIEARLPVHLKKSAFVS